MAESQLREFLRTRRARITPGQAGLPEHPGLRRVPGLRREEVAQLAGVSVDYYTRLERGRNTTVSASVLDAVARVLQLDETERDHLFALAKPARTRRRPVARQQLRRGLLRVLDTVADVPAIVLGHRMDVLAANRLARAFYVDFDALPERERNMARFVFLHPPARDFYVDWAATARSIVASLHQYAGLHSQDPRLAELVGELSVTDPDFRRWWAEHDVYVRDHGTKDYRHPQVGELSLGYEAFHPVGSTDQVLGLHTVEPGSPSEAALRLLATMSVTPGAGITPGP
ncbi:MAG TPA: helix-turn-helix transcriptional regulator [Pseudonocardiaceae bacterium]|nr:helix-turn-helix transcriptional regulator [Pseudonocardiaceae bacterium]